AHRRGHVVDEGAVGALQVHGVIAVGPRLNAGVPARDGMVVDSDFTVATAADDEGTIAERVATAHAGTGGINVDQAGVTADGGDRSIGCGDPRFRYFLHGSPVCWLRGRAPAARPWLRRKGSGRHPTNRLYVTNGL